MTSAERLIRSACDQRRAEIRDYYKTLTEVNERTITLAEAPTTVRRAAMRVLELSKELSAQKKTLADAGYDPPHDPNACSCDDEEFDGSIVTIQRDYKTRRKVHAEYDRDRNARDARIAKLQTTAATAVLGQDLNSARIIVRKLLVDVAGV